METLGRIISALAIGFLVLISIAMAFYGATTLTQATTGVGVICLGVFVAILARLMQAADHHAEVRKLLERPPK